MIVALSPLPLLVFAWMAFTAIRTIIVEPNRIFFLIHCLFG